MSAARLAWTLAAFVACGGTTSTAATDGGGVEAGDSSPGAVVPDAFVSAAVGTGPQTPPNACPVGGGGLVGFMSIGVKESAQSRPSTLQDGSSLDGAVVHVACSVTPVGGGFDVALSASWDNPNGGSLTVSSAAGQGAVTANGGAGIAATFQNPTMGAYQANDCTLAFTYDGEPVPSMPSVTAGRIWAHVSCFAAVESGGPGQCDAEADFLFEECTQ